MHADTIQTVQTVQTEYNRTKWSLTLRGILGIAVGVLIFTRPLASIAALALVIAVWAFVDGVTNIIRGFSLRHVAPHWWSFLVTGIIGVLFGLAALYYFPALSLVFAVVWSALWLIVGGATAIYVALQERRLGMGWGWMMTFGVLAIIAGIVDYARPRAGLGALMGLLAGFGIIGGIVMLIAAARLGSAQRRFDAATDEMKRDLGQPQEERPLDERDKRDKRDSRAA